MNADGERVRSDAPLTRVFFKPDEIEIQDNWHVSGLRGSGSSDYIAENVWVPAARLSGNVEDTPHASRPIYQIPQICAAWLPHWRDLFGDGYSLLAGSH